jgi:hypothetical protein
LENNIGNSRKSLFPGKQLPYSLNIVAVSILLDKRMIALAESAGRTSPPNDANLGWAVVVRALGGG